MKGDGRKRILSLDGGGIRGLISIEVLARIESLLQEKHNQPELVLSDYFDMFAGTSTGAIIATALSLGWSVSKIKKFYEINGQGMFDKSFLWGLGKHKYSGEALKELLMQADVFGDRAFGSSDIQSLLMLVMRNVTTDSPWVITNNPQDKYNDLSRSDSQLHVPLWQLVRASAAAPGFFPPEQITIGDKSFVFVDGSISSFTNPAFMAFLRAVAKPYNIHWQPGEDKLLIVSVGTGVAHHRLDDTSSDSYNLATAALTVPASIILSTITEQDTLCRIFGNCVNGHQIDREIGDLIGIESPANNHLFTYARYNDELTQTALERMGLGHINCHDLLPIDSINHMNELKEVGKAVAKQVELAHLI